MNQQKNLVGSSQDTNSTKKPVFLKISPKKETLISNISVVGSNPNKNVISMRKSNLVGSSASSISVVESIYRKSSVMIGSIVESIKDVEETVRLKPIEHVSMFNSAYFPSPKFDTGITYNISKFPDPSPVPVLTPSFDSTEITFDSENFTFDNSY